MNNPTEKYCQCGAKMYKRFNSSIWVCPICLNKKNKEMLKRSVKKRDNKEKVSFTSKKTNKKVRVPNESKNLDKALDKEWSLLVKLRAGNKCEYCDKTPPIITLNSHHIFSRKNQSVKYDVMNGICLCVNHHKFDPICSAHTGTVLFTKWLNKYKGESFMLKLEQRSRNSAHYTIADKRVMLSELKREINKFKSKS